MSNEAPNIPLKGNYRLEMQAGTYFWCACGQSTNQPFCDGSHKGTAFTPVKVEIDSDRLVSWCGCKHSAKGAFCDGTHKTL
ncbi:CDGSH iron-sulfur domain-containing protein [bacterium]|nr:CDGSH iron-sulfur domain-containing protein [bacterium]